MSDKATASVTVESKDTIQGTAADFQRAFDLGKDGYTTINGFLKFLESRGLAKNVGSRKSTSGKGKPATIWEIPKSFKVNVDAIPAEEAKPADAAA